MNDEEQTPPTTRTGSGADLARRMDRMEARQDNIETEVRTLASTVQRVEQNQLHAAEVSGLRFDALDIGLKSLLAQSNEFAKRFESIMSGEVVTASTKRILDEYEAFKSNTERRLDEQDLRNASATAKSQGIFATFTGAKAVLLILAALASPIITIIAILASNAK